MTATKFILAGAAIFSLLLILATRNPAPVLEAAAEQGNFDEAWVDAMKVVTLSKADLEQRTDQQRMISTAPRPVMTERIVVDPAPTELSPPATMPPVDIVEDQPEKVSHRKQHAERDVCVRHKMHKVYYRKTWRCRK